MLKLNRRALWELAELTDREVGATLMGQRDAPPAQNRLEAVGMTVSSALPTAVEAWRPLMSRLGVRARLVGAFSFGAPQIEVSDPAGKPRRGPLADLMMIVDDLRPTFAGRTALLIRAGLQAEAVGGPPEAGACALRDLYDTWPAFRFRRRGYAESPRDLRGEMAADNPGRRATISLRPGGWSLDAANGDVGLTLGRLLALMATGAEGRPATRGGEDDWSVTVDELLKETVQATLRGLASPTPALRSATTFVGEAGTGHVLFENPTDRNYEQAVGVAGLEGPISVVHLCLDAAPRPAGRAGRTSTS
ncbi:MAG: hypothetical protein JF588_12805 [Caulobacterales bacterium]|nr:hypothetical protein [Caulobacterales bacterium]